MHNGTEQSGHHQVVSFLAAFPVVSFDLSVQTLQILVGWDFFQWGKYIYGG